MDKSIKNWSEQDRPREKLLKNGASTLSDAELLAILMGSGNRKKSAVELGREILEQFNNDLSKLGRCTTDELKQFQGVGIAKAVSITSALELGKRRKEIRDKKFNISDSKHVNQLMSPLIADLPHEEFWVVYLDRGNNVIDKQKLSSGGTAGTVIDVKFVMKNAILKLAQSLVVAHNHPSGNINPSESDKKITGKIKNASDLMEIKLLDHLIICDNGYYSFADNGILNNL